MATPLANLPDSSSPDLHLAHPTPNECLEIWKATYSSWGDALDLPIYLKESQFLTTIPLAKDGVDKDLPEDKRPILCSCESFFKRGLLSDPSGRVEDVIIQGIASVFCPEEYRGRGMLGGL